MVGLSRPLCCALRRCHEAIISASAAESKRLGAVVPLATRLIRKRSDAIPASYGRWAAVTPSKML